MIAHDPSVVEVWVGPVSKYQEFFAPLGELTITFSMLEQQLSNAIRILCSLSYRETADLDWLSPEGRIKRFKRDALRVATVPELRAEIPKLVDALDDARNRRNNAQHGPWLMGLEQTESAPKIDLRKNPVEWRDHTPTSIHEDAVFCFRVSLSMASWTGRFITEERVLRKNMST